MKVLILCTGNSCRSQMAHGWLQSFDASITVCSAGTKPAGKVSARAAKYMSEAGVDISGHSSDPVERYLDEDWDYVITVCGNAHEVCPTFLGKVRHRLHMGFDDPGHVVGPEELIAREFVRVRDEIKQEFYQLYLTQIKPQL